MYWWKYIEKIEPIREPSAFIIGKLFHSLMENYYIIGSKETVIDMAKEQYKEQINNTAPEEQEDAVVMISTAFSMFRHMPQSMMDAISGSEVETHFEIPLFEEGGDKVLYHGFIDRIFDTTIREFKTTMNPDAYVRYAAVSPQASGYIIGAMALGKKVNSVTFDLVRKPLLRKKQTEDCAQFCKRIDDDYKTRPEFYYKREFTYRSAEQLNEFREDIKRISFDILSKTKTNDFWRNHEACFSRGECPYYKICFSNDSLTRDIFYKPVLKDNHDIAEEIE